MYLGEELVGELLFAQKVGPEVCIARADQRPAGRFEIVELVDEDIGMLLPDEGQVGIRLQARVGDALLGGSAFIV